jgi:hypothetical protein
VGRGSPCTEGYSFIPDRGRALPAGSPCTAASVASSVDPSTVMTILFDAVGVVLLSCTRAIFGSAGSLRGPVPAWLVQSRSRFLLDYIRLPRDAHGNILLPKLHVKALVERRHVWDRLIRMDSTTRAMVHGKLCYPRVGWDILPYYMQNHKSWDVAAVKAKLGAKMAAYFFQGAAEYVLPGHPFPSIVEPMGAILKKGPDEFRHISDARRGNKWLADWGVRYYSARDLAFALSWRAIVNGHDINDGYRCPGGLHRPAGLGVGHRPRGVPWRRRFRAPRGRGSRRLLPAGPGPAQPARPVRLRLAPARGLLVRRLRPDVRQVLHGHVL